jgi:hypothetical protein
MINISKRNVYLCVQVFFWKFDYSHPFVKVPGFLFHTWKVMGIKIYKCNMVFLLCVHACVDIVGYLCNELGNNDKLQKNTYIYKPFNFFVCVHSIHSYIFNP